jgi:hypothetical protein
LVYYLNALKKNYRDGGSSLLIGTVIALFTRFAMLGNITKEVVPWRKYAISLMVSGFRL